MAVTINRYNLAIQYWGSGVINLASDTFKLELYTGSHTFVPTHTQRSDVSANALGSGAGYLSPGQNLAGVVWSSSGNVATFTANPVSWTAASGSIDASHGVLYSDTATTPVDALLYSIDFDGAQSAGDGTQFLVSWNASGIFTAG